jgi:hypothetical protein
MSDRFVGTSNQELSVTYTDMMAAIRAAITAHNSVAAQKIDEATVVDKIIALGGTTEDAMMQLAADDLIACGLPPLMAKSLIKSFHASVAAPAPAAHPTLGAGARGSLGGIQGAVVMDMATALQGSSPRDLIAGYQIDNPGNIGAELVRRLTEVHAAQDAFLIYVNGSLDVDASTRRYELLLRGRRVTDTVIINDVPIRPLRVGERLVDEPLWINPLFPDSTLLEPEQVCEFTNLSWDGIGPEIRGIFLLAIRSGELRFSDTEIARGLIEVAKGATALRDIRRRYPGAAADWAALPDASKPPLQVAADPHRYDRTATRAAEGRLGRPFPAADLPSWTGHGPRVLLLGAPGDPMVAELAKHLVSARRAGRLQFWHAGMVKGSVRDGLIAMAESADVAVLMVSVDLLAALDDDPALAVVERRHAAGDITVLPVLGRPADLEDVRGLEQSTWFGKLQRIPRNEVPLSQWTNKESGFATAATEIGAALKGTRLMSPPAPAASATLVSSRMLHRDEIMKIHALAVRTGICSRRDMLLLGLPEDIKQSLPVTDPSPSGKIMSDLFELSRMTPVDGEYPMAMWLRNAIAARPMELETPFAVYVEALTGAPYRSPSADLYAATQR